MAPGLDVKGWLDSNPPKTCDAASISQPVRLGVGWTKSGTETNAYSHNDFSGLSPLQIPSVPLDLNQGIENFVPKSADDKAGVEILIRESFAAGAPLENCDILTFRNNLNKIFGTVFSPDSPWIVDGTILKSDDSKMPSTLFLDIVKIDEVEATITGANSGRFIAWGYNFEAKCTGAPYADANSEYGMMVSIKLEHNGNNSKRIKTEKKQRVSIYLGAEIDAYDPVEAHSNSSDVDSIPPMSSLREIKTFTRPEHPGQWRTTYTYRHPKWWLQSYLAGVPAVVLGARDKHGIVHEIHTIATADLPRISRNKGCTWSPQQALAFGADVLTFMTEVCQSEDFINKHVRFEYIPSKKQISVSILEGELADLPGRVTATLLEQQEKLKLENIE